MSPTRETVGEVYGVFNGPANGAERVNDIIVLTRSRKVSILPAIWVLECVSMQTGRISIVPP